jgi:hypothetical protein
MVKDIFLRQTVKEIDKLRITYESLETFVAVFSMNSDDISSIISQSKIVVKKEIIDGYLTLLLKNVDIRSVIDTPLFDNLSQLENSIISETHMRVLRRITKVDDIVPKWFEPHLHLFFSEPKSQDRVSAYLLSLWKHHDIVDLSPSISEMERSVNRALTDRTTMMVFCTVKKFPESKIYTESFSVFKKRFKRWCKEFVTKITTRDAIIQSFDYQHFIEE